MDSDERVYTEVCAHCNCEVFIRASDWAPNTRYYCAEHALLKGRDPQFVVPQAVAEARAQLTEHSDSFVRWELPSMHEMLGFLMRGTVTYGCALPGNGKTSMISQQIAYWDAAGKRPWVMPTESRPKGLMTRLVCRRLGVSSDEAMSGRLRARADHNDLQAQADIAALEHAYRQLEETLYERDSTLAIEPAPHLTRTLFRNSLMAAKQWGAGIVIVDHCDHIRGDETTGNGYQASEAVQNDAQEFAELFDLPVLMMSQLNRSKTEGDPLAIYKQPQVSWIWMPGAKEQNATTIFGIFRPMLPDVDEALMKAVKAGRTQSWKIAVPHCMGILDMKTRMGGERRDRLAHFHYQHGALSEMPPSMRLEFEAAAAGIRTHASY